MIIECPECGTKNTTDKLPQSGKIYRCGKCHAEITLLEAVDTPIVKAEIHKTAETPTLATENTSGQGKLAVVPREIEGWNWAAFLLSFIWSIQHNVWIGLLSLVPFAGIIMSIILLVKGNEWAWQNKRWDSIKHFKATQKKWEDWGIGLTAAAIFIGFIIAIVSYLP